LCANGCVISVSYVQMFVSYLCYICQTYMCKRYPVYKPSVTIFFSEKKSFVIKNRFNNGSICICMVPFAIMVPRKCTSAFKFFLDF